MLLDDFAGFHFGVICRGTMLIYQVLYIIGILILARGLYILYIILYYHNHILWGDFQVSSR